MAEKCARIQNLSFAGVDIARKDSQYFIIECNRNPAFEHFDKALHLNTARLLMDFIRKDLCERLKCHKKTSNKLNQTTSNTISENDTPRQKRSSLVFHQPVYGNIYVESTQKDSNSTWSITESDETINQLLEIIKSSTLPEVAKVDAVNDLNSIKELKKDSINPDVLASIERKTNTINKIIKSSSEIAAKGAPLLHILIEMFGLA
jgi:hypothetical protein